jgi:ribosomal-protein-alanine N-acetyltransferase
VSHSILRDGESLRADPPKAVTRSAEAETIDIVIPLETARLVLREYSDDDWQTVLAYQSDLRYLRYYPWSERDATTVLDWMASLIARQTEQPRDVFQLAITLPEETGVLIGSCGVRVNDRARREGNIGYELNPEYWGRGYATEAAWAMLSYGFDHLGLHRIWAELNAENAASAHVLEKLGMQREAHFREQDYFKGRWWDGQVYAILDREWRAQPKPSWFPHVADSPHAGRPHTP